MADADADFITIMAPDRTRWTHPSNEELGKPYIGSIDAALNGQVFTEITAGTLGPSVRTIAPVKDADGTVRALVAAGVTVRTVDIAVSGRLPALLAIGLALLAGGSAASGCWAVPAPGHPRLGPGAARPALRVLRIGPALGPRGRDPDRPQGQGGDVQRPGRRTAGLALPDGNPDIRRRPRSRRPRPQAAPSLAELPLAPSLKELFESGRTAHDEIHLTGSRILVVNQGPAVGPAPPPAHRRPAAVYGTVATIRDRTEIESLGSELETMRTLSDALRAQTHEHANRLHTIVSLMELGRGTEALDFATKDLELSQRLTDDLVSSIEEPVLGALIMGKAAEAHERGVELTLNTGGSTAVTGLAVQDLVAILGNLLDNAIDAAAEAPAPRLVELTVEATRRPWRSRWRTAAPGSIRRPWTTSSGTASAPRLRGRSGAAWGWPWSARRCSGWAVP